MLVINKFSNIRLNIKPSFDFCKKKKKKKKKPSFDAKQRFKSYVLKFHHQSQSPQFYEGKSPKN